MNNRHLYITLLLAFGLTRHVCADMPLKAGPYILCAQRGQVTAYWHTETAVPSVLEYGSSRALGLTRTDRTPKRAHKLNLPVQTGLTYFYRVHEAKRISPIFQFDATFSSGREPISTGTTPYPEDKWSAVYAEAAEFIVAQYGQGPGICVDYGCGQGRLAWEITRRSRLRVIGFRDDPKQVVRARQILDDAGVYGTRIVIHQADLRQLDCRDYLANLIVSDQLLSTGTMPGSASEMFRILRPDGGMALLGTPRTAYAAATSVSLTQWLGDLEHSLVQTPGAWTWVRRKALPGAGTWDHFYANAAHTAASQETRLTDRMQLLWYGQPGPRHITDRHNRPMASLYREGIMVTPGLDRLMAYDAYNGTRYWDMVIPQSTRVAALRDSAWVCLAPERVYVAHGRNCVALDLKTGIPQQHFVIPPTAGQAANAWGYVSYQDDRLYGSSQRASASVIGQNRPRIMAFSYGDNRPIAVSESLFCRDRQTGELRWTYGDGKQVIINPSIALDKTALVFLESTAHGALSSDRARLPATALLTEGHAFLVSLDPATGTVQWRRPVTLPFQHVIYVQIAEGQDLIVASGARDLRDKIQYDIFGFGLQNGHQTWSCSFTTEYDIGAAHGEQEQHPVIIRDQLYTKYFRVDLHTGDVAAFALDQATRGCATISGCATHVFARGGNPFMYGLPGTQGTRLTTETRPGCWINIFPVGGLVMIPESSSGCSCDFPIQATMAFQPLHRSEAPADEH